MVTPSRRWRETPAAGAGPTLSPHWTVSLLTAGKDRHRFYADKLTLQ